MTNFSIAWKKAFSRENSTERRVKILWLLRRGMLQGGGLLNASFFAVSCKAKANVLFLLMLHYSGIRSLATVGLDHFLWGFVLGMHNVSWEFISTVTLSGCIICVVDLMCYGC